MVYAYYATEGRATRVRVGLDDLDQLGLAEGMRVRLALPGGDAADVLITSAARVPPFAWLTVESVAPGRSRAG